MALAPAEVQEEDSREHVVGEHRAGRLAPGSPVIKGHRNARIRRVIKGLGPG